ncbi:MULTISPECIES: hypothetical protein [unclassified Mesorhizobium]|uniref:hypothetical protein n=1 Tax=unclassified Mesorhizobium TaxID=325217 RepID=UPI003338C1F1
MKAKDTGQSMKDKRSEGAKRILEQVATDRFSKDTEQAYRDFVDSINRSKDADMERALTLR